MPTALSFTHTVPPHPTHYFSRDLGTLSLGIPYHTYNATKVARETAVFFFWKPKLSQFDLIPLVALRPNSPRVLS